MHSVNLAKIMKIATWKNLIGQLKMKSSPLILSLDISRISMITSLLMNIFCKSTNVVGEKRPIHNMDFVGDQFSLPLEDFENLSPHDISLSILV